MGRRPLDSPALYVGLAVLFLAWALLSQFEVRTGARPTGGVDDLAGLRARDDVNVLFILLDTLRADRLSSYGYERETSPFLDRLAATGIRFERCVSQSSWTKASMASLWTSTYPFSNRILRYAHALPERAVLPAEILAEAGFRAAGIYRNGWVHPNFGFAQGFAPYYRPAPGRAPERFAQRSRSSHPLVGSDESITESALEFLRTHGRDRFLLYLHYMDIHQYAYDERAAKFGTGYSDAYDNAIAWVDRNVGAILDALARRELADETLVVIASDHGEEFREHGREGHARQLYREVIDVPLIMALPFHLEPGVSVRSTVQNLDVWPTILDLLGLPALPGAEGRSLVPLIEAAVRGDEGVAGEFGERPALAYLDRTWGSTRLPPSPIFKVTLGPYRMIRALRPGAGGAAAELFDHRSDPLEQRNLSRERPEIVQELQSVADAVLGAGDREPWWGPPGEVELERLRLDQLRALGYAIE